MKKLLLALLLVSSQCFAVAEFYSIGRSTRALGMGGAFYGMSNDQDALLYNPAGLATYKGGGRFSLLGIKGDTAFDTISAVGTIKDASGKNNVNKLVTDLSKYQGTPLYGGVGVSLLGWQSKNFAIGLVNTDIKTNIAILGKDIDTTVDVTAIGDAGVIAGYARSFMEEKLFVGINVKGLVRGGGRKTFSVDDIAKRDKFDLDPKTLGGAGFGVDFDLGGTYELPIKQFGPFIFTRVSLVFNNIIASKFDLANITGTSANIPGLVRTMTLAGYSALEGWGPFDNFHLLFDLAEFSLGGESRTDYGARSGGFFKHVNLGVEAPMRGGWFTPRLGIHQGYFTLGVTFDLRALKIDLATYEEELATGVGRLGSRRVAFRLVLGWGQPPPAITKGDAAKDQKTDGVTPPPTQEEIDKAKKEGEKAKELVDPNKVEPVKDPNAKPEPAKDVPQMQEDRKPKSELAPESQQGTSLPARSNDVSIPNQ